MSEIKHRPIKIHHTCTSVTKVTHETPTHSVDNEGTFIMHVEWRPTATAAGAHLSERLLLSDVLFAEDLPF